MRWVILDLGELPCLIDVSKLNPGPSGEDADAVGQPRDVGSPCASALGLVDIGALSELSRQKTGLLHWRARSAPSALGGVCMSITPYLDEFDADSETKRVLAVALEMTRVALGLFRAVLAWRSR